MLRYGMVMVWYGQVWYDKIWYYMIRYDTFDTRV